jgi:taurine dioxygenase
MWSSQYRALEELSPQVVDMLTGMTATHTPTIPDGREAHHPLVIQHPENGRRALYLNHLFTQRIDQLSKLESDAILGMLKQHSVRPEFTCRWRWTKGDVAIWDNNFVQHYAIGDYTGKRAIQRVEVVGAPLIPAVRA